MMKFLYFAYGSNLLSKRMHINCPSAIKKDIAVLKNFKLAFTGFGDRWRGSAATIIEDESNSVCGVVWEICKTQEDLLDRQECGYNPLTVAVHSPSGHQYTCKTYQKMLDVSENHLPSAVYKVVIIQGAQEHCLPEEYIRQLKSIKDNGYTGPVDVPLDIHL